MSDIKEIWHEIFDWITLAQTRKVLMRGFYKYGNEMPGAIKWK